MAWLLPFETLLRRALLILTLVLPCLFGFMTTYVLLLLLVVAFVYLFGLQWRGERALQLGLAGKLFLIAFVGLAALIALNAVLDGAPAEIRYGLDFGMFLLYAPLAGIYVRGAKPGNVVIVADLALAGTVVAFLLGVVEELVYHPERAGYLTSDPIRYADTAVILGFLSLMGLVARTSLRRWIYLLGPVLGLGAVLMSGSRSAMLAFPVMAIVAAVLLVRRKALAVGVGAGAVALFAAVFALADFFNLSRALTILDVFRNLAGGGAIADESTRQRFVIYRAGLSAFWQSPWIGVGWHRRMAVAGQYMPPADKGLAALPHLHDEVLNFAVGGGVIAVLIYLMVIATPILACLKSPRDSQYQTRLYGCWLLVASYVSLGLADVMISFELHTSLFMALTALLLAFCRDTPETAPRT